MTRTPLEASDPERATAVKRGAVGRLRAETGSDRRASMIGELCHGGELVVGDWPVSRQLGQLARDVLPTQVVEGIGEPRQVPRRRE